MCGNDKNAFSKPDTIQPWKWEVIFRAKVAKKKLGLMSLACFTIK